MKKILIDLIKKIYSKWHKLLLHDDNFTIISNNCWGGIIYKYFGIRFQTPTVGMYFFADEYLKMLSDLRCYLQKKMIVTDYTKSKYKDILEERGQHPLIGMLGDVEFVLLHYKTPEEAIEKWEYRVKRVNFDRMIVKFNDQNLCTSEHIKRFDRLPYENKICFAARAVDSCKSVVVFKEYSNDGWVKNDTKQKYWNRYFDIIKYLNNMK
jgi:uncharacterized protein (DUF1919 family)